MAEERFGRYGITRTQRSIWMGVLVACSLASVGFAVLALVATVTDHPTIVAVSAPLIGVFCLWGFLVLWGVLSGSPEQR